MNRRNSIQTLLMGVEAIAWKIETRKKEGNEA